MWAWSVSVSHGEKLSLFIEVWFQDIFNLHTFLRVFFFFFEFGRNTSNGCKSHAVTCQTPKSAQMTYLEIRNPWSMSYDHQFGGQSLAMPSRTGEKKTKNKICWRVCYRYIDGNRHMLLSGAQFLCIVYNSTFPRTETQLHVTRDVV